MTHRRVGGVNETLTGTANMTGGTGSDTLTGDTGGNMLNGGGGEDVSTAATATTR